MVNYIELESNPKERSNNCRIGERMKSVGFYVVIGVNVALKSTVSTAGRNRGRIKGSNYWDPARRHHVLVDEQI